MTIDSKTGAERPDTGEAQRRARIIDEVMRDDPQLTADEATALYDEATLEAAHGHAPANVADLNHGIAVKNMDGLTTVTIRADDFVFGNPPGEFPYTAVTQADVTSALIARAALILAEYDDFERAKKERYAPVARLVVSDMHGGKALDLLRKIIATAETGKAGAIAATASPAPADQVRVTGFRGNPLRVVLSSGQEATVTQKLVDAFASPSPFNHAEGSANG